MTNQRILITGAGGYLAAALMHRLRDTPCHIVRLGRSKDRFPAATGKAAFSDMTGDIRDPAVWESALEGVDVVFHFAAQTSVPLAEQDPWTDFQVNVAPVMHLLEACRRNRWRPSVLFSSTVTIAGIPQTIPVTECHPDHPITLYDLHKQVGENYLKYYAGLGRVQAVILRLANVYGPGPSSGSADRGILNQMIRKALRGEALTVYGSGEQVRDYVYVDDVVQAFVAAAENIDQVNGRHFVIGSGEGCSIRRALGLVAQHVLRNTGREPEVRRVDPPEPRPAIEARNFVADTTAFTAATGWSASIGLEEGLDRTIQSLLSLSVER